MIKKILVKEPSKRLNAEQILCHPWILGEGAPDTELKDVPEKIKEYSARNRLRKAAQAVIAIQRINKILQDKNFNKEKK